LIGVGFDPMARPADLAHSDAILIAAEPGSIHAPMSTKAKLPATKENLERDLVSHARLPVETQELLDLEDQASKSTGAEQVVITQQIEEKARKAQS
jgi:hypothetical protein